MDSRERVRVYRSRYFVDLMRLMATSKIRFNEGYARYRFWYDHYKTVQQFYWDRTKALGEKVHLEWNRTGGHCIYHHIEHTDHGTVQTDSGKHPF